MEVDDGSDLTSLEEGEYQLDGAATRKDKDVPLKSDSGLSSEEEDMQRDDGVKSQNGPANITQLSPSRVGSSLARPAPVAGLKTYSRKREHSGRSFKQERSPKREQARSESPLSSIPSPSPSPRKRRVPSAANQKPPGTPSKRPRKGKNTTVDLKLDDEKPSVPNGKHKSTSDHVSRRPRSSPISKPEANGNVLSVNKVSEPSSPLVRRKRGRRPKNQKAPKPAESLNSIGNLTWVRVNRENGIVDDDTVESFWWPATVEHSGNEPNAIHARLLFPPSGSESPIRVTLNNPSSSNILSYKDRSYTANSFWSLPSSSTRSQPTGFDELRSQWERACKEIMKEDLRLHDGFPTSLTALLSQPLRSDDDAQYDSVSRQASPEQLVASPRNIHEDAEPWSPPPPEHNIAIPGELVLSTTKTKGFFGKFYPAKVIAYVPPSRRTVPARYTVHFMDNLHEDVTRDMFYVYEQEGFGTCKLGQFESLESLEEKDDEDNPYDGLYQDNSDLATLNVAPPLPAPEPERFCELSIVEQTSYIIPILTKVIEKEYKPAEERITAFLNGGRQRAKMSKEAIAKGLLTRSELNEFARIIRSWTLHMASSDNEIHRVNGSHDPAVPDVKDQSSRWSEVDALQEEALSPVNSPVKEAHKASDYDQPPTLPPPSLPPSSTDATPTCSQNGIDTGDHDAVPAADEQKQRPVSDDRSTQNGSRSITAQSTSRSFHDLLNHEKIQFCTDVLLKEGVIQLLLWRAGKRRTPDLLSDTEELLLHESGSNLAGEFDIARTVRDLRMRKEKSLQGRGMLSSQTTFAGGTRSRQKKI